MALNKVSVGILLVVFCLSGWQVWNLSAAKRPAVLAETTTKTVEERVRLLENRVYVLEKNAGLIATAAKKTSESFVSLSGGDIKNFDWTKIDGTEFYFYYCLYGKKVEVSWQGWLEGAGSVRLFDSTNHRAVDYSEYSSSTAVKKSFYTRVMSIWRGQNQYYIEGKTVGGVVSLSAPRLKIVSK